MKGKRDGYICLDWPGLMSGCDRINQVQNEINKLRKDMGVKPGEAALKLGLDKGGV